MDAHLCASNVHFGGVCKCISARAHAHFGWVSVTYSVSKHTYIFPHPVSYGMCDVDVTCVTAVSRCVADAVSAYFAGMRVALVMSAPVFSES
eukprot:1154147-Pelagomonas_calceolata.AAC.5